MSGIPCPRCGAPVPLFRTLCLSGDLRCRACGQTTSALYQPAHFLVFYGLYGIGIVASLLLLTQWLAPHVGLVWVIILAAILPMVVLSVGCTALVASRAQQPDRELATELRLPVKVMCHLLGAGVSLAIAITSMSFWNGNQNTARSISNLPAPHAASTDALAELSARDLSWRCTNTDGEELVLGELTEQVLFCNVWATWCPPCITELPSIDALRSALPEGRVRFLLISTENLATVREFAAQQDLDLPFAASDSLPDALQTRSIPATFVLRGNRVLYQHVGSANWNDPAFRSWLTSISR